MLLPPSVRLKRPRVAPILVALCALALTFAGSGSSAWTLNQAQLDNGICGQNLLIGSDKTAAATATPSFLLTGDGGLAAYDIFIDDAFIGKFHSNSLGNVCITTTLPLSQGTHVLTGNELTPNPTLKVIPLTFRVDSIAPAAPSKPLLSAARDTGLPGDGITSFKNATLLGTAEPGMSIKIYKGATSVGGAAADAAGNWMATTTTLADATYSITAAAIDSAGNKSASSAPLALTVDSTLPTAVLTSPSAGSSAAGAVNLTADAADAGGVWKVDFIVDGVTKATDSSAPFSFAWSSSTVANGAHSLSARATDRAGNTATSTAAITVANGALTAAGAPTLNSATAGNASVTLAWSAPASNGGSAITGYKVYRGTTSGGETLLTTVGTGTTYTDTSAANGTTYYYQVSALNSVGEGVRSLERSATPVAPTSAPGAPTLNSATAGNASVGLAWSAPASDGGSPITGYKIYRGTASGGAALLTTVGTATGWTDTSALNGVTYYYQVSATNFAGEGARSGERSATPVAPATAPGAPTFNSATAGNASVALAWSAPASNGGSAVTGYRIYRGTASGGETLLTSVGTSTTYTDTSAANGTTYYYQVSALNSVGESARSGERSATAVAPVTVPAAPSLLSAVPGNSVTLTWATPATTGGSAITGYKIYRGTTSGGATFLTSVGAVTSYTDATTTDGTTYYYQVSAVSAAGEGTRSNELSATPRAPSLIETTPPSTPGSLRALTTGTTQIVLDWGNSTDNVAVAGYMVYRNSVLVGTVPTSYYTDSGLTPGASYTYVVKAVDAAGNQSTASSSIVPSTLSLLASSTGTLGGVAFDSTGTPLAGVRVSLVLPTGATRTTATTLSGIWKLSYLAPADYRPTFSLGGYGTQTLSMNAQAGRTLLATVVLTTP